MIKIQYIKYKTGKDYILEGHFVEISPGKFVSVILGEGIHLIKNEEIIKKEESSINLQGGWR